MDYCHLGHKDDGAVATGRARLLSGHFRTDKAVRVAI
jgi:hypothetical protein